MLYLRADCCLLPSRDLGVWCLVAERLEHPALDDPNTCLAHNLPAHVSNLGTKSRNIDCQLSRCDHDRAPRSGGTLNRLDTEERLVLATSSLPGEGFDDSLPRHAVPGVGPDLVSEPQNKKMDLRAPRAEKSREWRDACNERSRKSCDHASVMLADPLSSYVSGATIAVTGGKPIL